MATSTRKPRGESHDDANNTLVETLKALRGTIAAAHTALPGVVGVITFVAAGLIWVAIHSVPLMMGVIVVIVVFASVLVYGSTSNYGEAALALVAGLLTAFTVTWDSRTFVMFTVAWISFTFFALIISSIRVAAAVEDIYRQAALSISVNLNESKIAEEKLKKIGNEWRVRLLGPVESAEVVRILAFRKIPIPIMKAALQATGTLVVITKLDYKSVALFISEVYRLFNVQNEIQANLVLEHVNSIIREVPTSPQEFLQAYESSRGLARTLNVQAKEYFGALRDALEQGVSPEDMREVLTSRFDRN